MSESRLFSLAQHWLGREFDTLPENERRVVEKLAHRRAITRDPGAGEDMDFGARMADRVARLGGSWGFLGGFALFMACWCGLNLALGRGAFDPYPFIFLNLMLSMLAAIQAPVIMMSQNRQAEKDRRAATHDYEVNLKAELEIMALHDKLDRMRSDQMETLLKQQQAQIALLTETITRLRPQQP